MISFSLLSQQFVYISLLHIRISSTAECIVKLKSKSFSLHKSIRVCKNDIKKSLFSTFFKQLEV